MRLFATATLTVTFLVLLQGCDSVIEETGPSTAIPQEVGLSDPDGIRGVRASMFDRMHGSNAGTNDASDMTTDWLLGPSSLADNTFFRGNQARHQGLNLNNLRAGVGTGAYDDLYGMINDANILISGIEEGALPDAEDTKFKAEARFMRALALHHAVRIFGYDPDGNGGVVSPNSGPGAGFDLGVVIRTTPTLAEADATPKARSTVLEVYDQILTDLNESLSLFEGLSEDAKEGSPFFPSEAAVHGLLARVNLYQRNWAEADARAQRAIDGAASLFGSAIAGASELAEIFNERSTNPEAIFTISTNPQLESAGVNEAISAYTSIQWVAQLPTQDLMSLYEEGDARRTAWYEPCFDEVDGEAETGCDRINDEGLELHKYASEQGVQFFADDYIHLRIAEMVLIQAEARLNTSGPAAAIARLNDLRTMRGASDLSAGGFEETYDAILDERRRELVAEGHRFFDLKRLGRDIRKAPGTGEEDVPFNDIRILDDLPSDQLPVNTELVQNPGYND